MSQETRDKIGRSNKGKKMSERTKIQISIAQKGRVHSQDEKIKRANSLVGQKRCQMFSLIIL